jgi:hypothetical protein
MKQNGTTTQSDAPRPKTKRDAAAQSDYQPEPEPSPRKPAAARENAFNALAWLADGATGLIEEVRHNDLGLSEEFWVHLYSARRESLLAARALIDALLERLDQENQKEQEREKRRERRGDVKIDF